MVACPAHCLNALWRTDQEKPSRGNSVLDLHDRKSDSSRLTERGNHRPTDHNAARAVDGTQPRGRTWLSRATWTRRRSCSASRPAATRRPRRSSWAGRTSRRASSARRLIAANWHQRSTAMQLRHRDTRSLDTYEARGRIVPGSIDQRLETIAGYWTECRARANRWRSRPRATSTST